MTNEQQQTEQPAADATYIAPTRTYCVFEIFPKHFHPLDSGLAKNIYLKLACSILRIANEFCHTCGAWIEFEPWGFEDISEGRPPAPILNRVYRHVNGGRSGEGLFIYSEPGEQDADLYREYFGNKISDNAVTVLVPLDKAFPALNYDDNSIFIYQDAANAARNALRQLPAARIEETFLDLGLAENRHAWKLRTLKQGEVNPHWDD
jgi:hypothetical protein